MEIINPKLFSMTWGVCEKGYEFIDEAILKPKSQNQRNWKPYDPFDLKKIARDFSEIPLRQNRPDSYATHMFVSKYGLLGFNNDYGMQREDINLWSQLIKDVRHTLEEVDKGKSYDASYFFSAVQSAPRMQLVVNQSKDAVSRTLTIKPNTLADAIWLMVADEVANGTQFQQCQAPNCNEWFKKRSNQKTCSNKCRMSLSRYNQRLLNKAI